MNLLNRAFSFYVFSNIHVALSASCLVLMTLDYGNSSSLNTVVFVFCATVLAYNFIQHAEMDRTYPVLAHWTRSSSKPLLALNLLMLAGLVYALLNLRWPDIFLLFPFFLLTLFYVYPGTKKFKGLRSLPGLKLFVIALVWAGVTVLFPLSVSGIPFGEGEWVVFAQRFLLILAITLPFDIRDLQLDDEQLATLPQTLGVNNSKWVALLALSAFVVLFFVGAYFNPAERYVGLFVAVISAVLVLRSGIYQGRFFSAFWVESIPIAWYLLTLWFT